jgi:hypothetical protein
MSFENVVHHSFSRVAGADLSTKQYYAVKLNSSAAAVLAGAGEFAVGILQNNPGNGQAASIATVGAISKAIAGGSITAGATVAVDSSGKLVDATEAKVNTSDAGSSTDAVIASNVIGVALAAASSGDIFPVLLTMSGATPTTAA